MAGIFNGAVLTRQGIALLAQVQAEDGTITLTKAAAGAGEYGESEDLLSCTELKDKRQEFALVSVRVQNDTNVYVKFVMSNEKDIDGNALAAGYHVKEIGIYARGSDGEEVLYAIATAATDQWDYMPSYSDSLPSTITVEFLAEVANADKVSILLKKDEYIYDETTGAEYVIGVEGGNLYYEKEEGTRIFVAEKEVVDSIITALLNTDEVEKQFLEVYFDGGSLPGGDDGTDPEAMTTEEIEEAINTEWDGSSSADETAMTAEEVEESVNTEWDGSSSADETAMTAEEIEGATQ